MRSGWGTYCSRECHYNDKAGRYFNCFTCNKKVYRTSRQVEHSKSKKYFFALSRAKQSGGIGNMLGNSTPIGDTAKPNMPQSWSDTKSRKVCANCGVEDKRVIATHHIDGNHMNNKIKNLTWLCHNCHHSVHNVKVYK